jgi:hypothetical protein
MSVLGCVTSDDRDLEYTKTLSSYFKLNGLEDVGPINMHLDSSRIKLNKLEDVGLICTHLISCCMVSAIYSKINPTTEGSRLVPTSLALTEMLLAHLILPRY